MRTSLEIPLAISMIGSMLYHRNSERDWPSFLQKEFSHISQEENDILPTLRLSYDCLPSHLKRCFAFCRLFPKDYEIDVPTLVTLWIAQGNVNSLDPSQSLEDIGYGYFMELFSRSFFQEDIRDNLNKIKTCKMHDLVRDLAIQVAGGDYVMINFGEGNVHKKVRNVSFEFVLRSSEGLPSLLLQAKRLRSILLPNQPQYSIVGGLGESLCDLIVSNFKFLRTLDMHALGIKKLPNSIGKLKRFRYLDLSQNADLEILPTCITKLVNLQTFKLNRCIGLKELPRDIYKLVNLRHLEYFHCSRLSYMPRGLGQLTNLQMLSQFVLSDNEDTRGSKLDELAELNNLSGQLKIRGLRHGIETKTANLKEKQNLRSISLKWYGNVYDSSNKNHNASSNNQNPEMMIEGLKPHPNLRKLTMKGYEGVMLSSWLPLLTNLVKLGLVDFPRCQQLPPLNQFPLLKKMKLAKLPCLQYIINDDIDGGEFQTSLSSSPIVLLTYISSSLQKLKLEHLPGLKGWWRLPDFSENQVVLPSFPCLSELTISDCPKLTCMPLYPIVEKLKLLNTSWKPFEQTTLISEVTTLKAEYQASSSSSAFSKAVASSSPLSKLNVLRLGFCTDVNQHESLPTWMKSLTSLKTLLTKNNPKLKYLSPVIQYLTSLQELQTENCEELTEISHGEPMLWEALTSLRILNFTRQQNLMTLPGGLHRATTLQNLSIKECHSFMAIPNWICKLCSLKEIYLSDCPNLKSLPGSISSLSSLRTLHIDYCPTLLERCQRTTGEDWLKIQHIPDLKVNS